MSDEFLILFYEKCPPEEMVGDPEHHLHCALLVGPPDAEGVARDICIVLNRDVGFMRNAAPHFAAYRADDPPDALLVQFEVERKGYAGHEGRPDGDPHSRAVAYNHKAEACLAPTRKLRGLSPASSADTGTGAQGGRDAPTPVVVEPERNGTGNEWPPSDHVAVSTIRHSAEYEKNSKNPPRTSIQHWEKKESVIKQYHPQSNEVAYPQEWVSRHWDAWFPRQPKRNTPP